MKKLAFLLMVFAIAFNSAAVTKKQAAKKTSVPAGETIKVQPSTDNVVTCLMEAYLTKHSELAGAKELIEIAENPSKSKYSTVNDTCAYIMEGDNSLASAIWTRSNGHTVVGFVYNNNQVAFYDYNPETGVMTQDRGVGVPITSILGGDYTISFNVDGIHCTVMRLNGYADNFMWNGSKFVNVKSDMGDYRR